MTAQTYNYDAFVSYARNDWSKQKKQILARYLSGSFPLTTPVARYATPVERAHQSYLAVMNETTELADEDDWERRAHAAEQKLLATRAQCVADMRRKLDVFTYSYSEDLISCVCDNKERPEVEIVLKLLISLALDLQALA